VSTTLISLSIYTNYNARNCILDCTGYRPRPIQLLWICGISTQSNAQDVNQRPT